MVIGNKGGHNHPFGDLGTVDSRGGGEGYFGVGIDRMVGNMIYASGEEMD